MSQKKLTAQLIDNDGRNLDAYACLDVSLKPCVALVCLLNLLSMYQETQG